ncbi:MAG: MmgE/PrpD family protein [Paracoccaceae bacterium]
MAENIARALAEFALGAGPPETALAMMRLSVFDWMACGAAGSGQPVARAVRSMIAGEGGSDEASAFGLRDRVPARSAALVNGAAGHALDFDDTHFAHIGHPSVTAVPAALAVAERCRAPGATMLAAALIGAEASIRVGIWLGRSHYQAGFHQTSTAGTFGAALAAARLLRLDPATTANALGLASTRASGLKSQFGTMGKPYNAGVAAANGVEASLLAAAGMVSDPGALDGDQGFGPTHAGEADTSALDGLGTNWLFETVSHKFHACCHGTHAALEALTQVRGGVEPAEVAVVTIRTHPRWLSVCDIAGPTTGLAAKFSFRLTAAMALAGRDTAAMTTFSDAACADPQLVALRDLVRVETDKRLPETAARVTLRKRDGSERVAAHDLAAPMAMGVRTAKLKAKAVALIGSDRAERAWQAVDAGPDADELARFVRAT